jgi:hypothetical protein
MLKLIICDWNRTLFEDYFEETFCASVFKFVAARAAKRFDLFEIISLLILAFKSKHLVRRARQGKTINTIPALIKLLNKYLFSKITGGDLAMLLERYVAVGTIKLDSRILMPLQSLRERKNIRFGIISSGYYRGIKQILEKSGFVFDFIIANDFLSVAPGGMHFEFKISSNKADVLEKILEEEKVEREAVMYIGDDSRDENCFREAGFPVVSFLAVDKDKQRFKKMYNAFVPSSQREFEEYLDKI